MAQPTHDEVRAWAQAIYDYRGPPPYSPTLPPGPPFAEGEVLCRAAEAALLSDFVEAWLPELKRSGRK